MNRISAWVLANLAISVCLFGGCGGGPKTVPVKGIVLLDGKPVPAGAAVQFIPKDGGHVADGITDASGRFSLTTFQPNDGALVGQHDVVVVGVRQSGVAATASGLSEIADPSKVKQEWFVPQKYAIKETSGQTVEVKRGMAEVKLELSSK
jgi:hypothetical protein